MAIDILFVEQQLKETVEQRIQQAELFLNRQLPRPQIDLQLKGRCAGQMCYKRQIHQTSYRLRLNLDLAKLHLKGFLEQVIPHEIAHLMVFCCFSGARHVKPHGREWQAFMMNCFMQPASVCHTFDMPKTVSRRPITRYKYSCDCQIHFLTQIRHRRVQNRAAQYSCKVCKGSLTIEKPILQS